MPAGNPVESQVLMILPKSWENMNNFVDALWDSSL